MIARIFSGAVTRGGVKSGNGVQQSQDKMSYTEFVWFLLSEEDKNHPTAIEYWFRYNVSKITYIGWTITYVSFRMINI